MKTAREQVIEAAQKRGLEVHEDGRRVTFGYFQISFKDNGNWWPECVHGPRLNDRRPSLRSTLEVLEQAPISALAPRHLAPPTYCKNCGTQIEMTEDGWAHCEEVPDSYPCYYGNSLPEPLSA
jgi:hypothetical protein